MGRKARITIVLAPFAFAAMPLAALFMTPGPAAPATTTIEVRTAPQEMTDVSGAILDPTEAAYNAEAECSLGDIGI